MNLIIHTDGGARGNPGPAATGFIITDESGVNLAEGGTYLGEATNNLAEYQAVIDALEWIQAAKNITGPHHLNFYLDSNLVVQQIVGKFKIKQPHLQLLAGKIHTILDQNEWVAHFFHVPREQNQAADRVVNQILDANS